MVEKYRTYKPTVPFHPHCLKQFLALTLSRGNPPFMREERKQPLYTINSFVGNPSTEK